MKSIFVTATNTNIGKTYTTLKLLKHFSKMGYKVGSFKPIETGVYKEPLDAKILLKTTRILNPNFNDISIKDICPIQLKLPAAPFVAKKNQKIDFNKILKNYKKIKDMCEILIIEGAGGLLVPVEDKFFMIDFIEYFDAHPLLVTGDKLGCINDTLLSLEALNNRDIKTSWCINLLSDNSDFDSVTMPFYNSHFKTIYCVQNDLTQLSNNLLSHL